MRIALPVTDKTLDARIAGSFGRTPYFLLYDTSSQTSEYLDNGAAASQGGAGIKAAQLVVDSKAQAAIVPQCGENAANVLKAGQVTLYKAMSDSIRENIQAVADGKLSLLDQIHAGFHNHGGR